MDSGIEKLKAAINSRGSEFSDEKMTRGRPLTGNVSHRFEMCSRADGSLDATRNIQGSNEDGSFLKIKQEYDIFYKSLMAKGSLPMRSTEKGFWNSSISEEIYSAFKKLKIQNYTNFLDLGSGDGKVVLIASLFCKNAEGIEIDSELHKKAAEISSKLKIKNAKFQNGDFFDYEISKYDLVFLSPDAPLERGVENKILEEMDGKLLVYGNHFHPRFLKKEKSFSTNGTIVTLYSRIGTYK
ncbi:MAG TPA: methyltransferase domain-containing protein [Candidatus Nanoarchaeia archaeon]|nr:methyltransferase domain-containing protein [Candidatus Nanoarchaeia archaeon]